jgi:SagB-type dehydrogenase family enzyme
MMKIFWLILCSLALTLTGCSSTPSLTPVSPSAALVSSQDPQTGVIELPQPKYNSSFSLEEALASRRSVREYSNQPLKVQDVSQLLWAAQGITDKSGGRTAPSAGALYPLEVYLVAGKVEELSSGIYKYRPEGHKLFKMSDGEVRESLANAALGQSPIKDGAINIVIAAVYERTTSKYGDRGVTYAHLEAGHAAQNLCLQAAALNLGAVTIGAFDDGRVKTVMGLAENETPLYIISVGKKQN